MYRWMYLYCVLVRYCVGVEETGEGDKNENDNKRTERK